jgi:hypothetical protein
MRPLAPNGGNDKVYTPRPVAEKIISHFKPLGKICEPCKGKGVFTDLLKCDWYEIEEGKDFLNANGHWDWIITNPPWSKIRPFLQKSMEVADNIVFLCLVNAFWMKARQEDMKKAGFGIKEILIIDTPPKPWPQTGFSLGAVLIVRGWSGQITVST